MQPKSLVMGTINLRGAVNTNAKAVNLSLANDIIFDSLVQRGDVAELMKNITINLPNDLHNWDVRLIVDYIEANYHQRSKDHAIDILALGQTLVYEYGNEYPETRELTVELFLLLHDYLNCIREEEEVLFPKIKIWLGNEIDPPSGDPKTIRLISNSITRIREEQYGLYEKLRFIHLMTNDYSLPVNACLPYRYLFEKMKEFEANLLLHVYLEDRILFPKILSKV